MPFPPTMVFSSHCSHCLGTLEALKLSIIIYSPEILKRGNHEAFDALLLLLSPANAAKMFPHLHAITLVDSLKMIALLVPNKLYKQLGG